MVMLTLHEVAEAAFHLDPKMSDERKLRLNLVLWAMAVRRIAKILDATTPAKFAKVKAAVRSVFGAGMLGQRKGKVPGAPPKETLDEEGKPPPRAALLAVANAMTMLSKVSDLVDQDPDPKAISTAVRQRILKPLALRLMYEKALREKR